ESINAGETFASVSDEVIATEEYSTATPEAAQAQAIELLDGVNLDYGDSFSIVIYGSGVLVALWILSAIVGAIDSIPLFP
ncbi:CAAD domain-containing protein, partial [Staphylococcus aureus]|nr:CAAD domain-containing protein [Staphylococcus aureus]